MPKKLWVKSVIDWRYVLRSILARIGQKMGVSTIYTQNPKV